MRHALFACAFALVATPSTFADIVLGPGAGHISGSVLDFSGFDSFTLDTPLTVPGAEGFSDFALSPGSWTDSGAALLTSISTSVIDLRGFANTTGIEGAAATALASITFSFTVTEAVEVNWFVFVLTDPDTFATVSLSGPGGEIPIGDSTLAPGVYSFVGSTGFTGLIHEAGAGTQFARFITTLTIVPSPGSLALLIITAPFAISRRRRCEVQVPSFGPYCSGG